MWTRQQQREFLAKVRRVSFLLEEIDIESSVAGAHLGDLIGPEAAQSAVKILQSRAYKVYERACEQFRTPALRVAK